MSDCASKKTSPRQCTTSWAWGAHARGARDRPVGRRLQGLEERAEIESLRHDQLLRHNLSQVTRLIESAAREEAHALLCDARDRQPGLGHIYRFVRLAAGARPIERYGPLRPQRQRTAASQWPQRLAGAIVVKSAAVR